MKKKTILIGIAITIVAVCGIFIGRVLVAEPPADAFVEGPFTNDNWDDFAYNVPIIIDNETLQTCYRYADSLGYGIKDKEKYISILLGELLVDAVHTGGDNDKRAMIDKNDIIVIFEEIRIVIDAESGAVLGRIPYV
jgi:hypothetical protein